MTRLSIVIPVYNGANYLREAIESALAQTFRNVEVLVVDDGSTDETAAVARSFRDVRYLYQENRGLAAARNTGLRESSGRFVVFLDADDRLLLGHPLGQDFKGLQQCRIMPGGDPSALEHHKA